MIEVWQGTIRFVIFGAEYDYETALFAQLLGRLWANDAGCPIKTFVQIRRTLGRRGILASWLLQTVIKPPENSSQLAVSLFERVKFYIKINNLVYSA